MKILKWTTTLALIATINTVMAQQIPVFNQYIYNPYLYNPAYAGYFDQGNVYLGHRSQWIEVPDGPVTNTLTFDMPINGTNIGVGVNIFSDVTHLVNEFGGLATYAYHLPFDNTGEHKLSIGGSVGVLTQRFDFGAANTESTTDVALLSEQKNGATFDLALGVNYKFGNLNVGVAVPQIPGSTIKYSDNESQSTKFSLVRHFLGQVGYKFEFGKEQEVGIEPVFLVRYLPELPLQFDANIVGNWKETVMAGVGYQYTNDGIWLNASAGVRIKDAISLMYTFSTNTEQTISSNFGTSHEIQLGYRFNTKNEKVEEMDKDLKELEVVVTEGLQGLDSLRTDLDEGLEKLDEFGEARDDLQDQITKTNIRVDSLEKRGPVIINKTTSVAGAGAMEYKKLGEVFFDQNSSTLSATAQSKIKELVNYINAGGRVVSIHLKGFASSEGSSEANHILSIRRAVSVKNYLVQLNFEQDKIIILPYGEENPITDTQVTESDKAKNRRVDISLMSE